MRTENLMEESEVNILHTYNRFPVVLTRGVGFKSTYVVGKKYVYFDPETA